MDHKFRPEEDHHRMEENKYTLIVIGAGMTGLSTALSWCLTMNPEHERILVLEKEKTVGGCVTTFAREGWRFDTVQIIPEVSDLLDYFGVKLKLLKYRGNYARLFLVNPATSRAEVLPVPSDRDEFENTLCSDYPREVGRIRKFFSSGRRMLDELVLLKTEPGILEGLGILLHCPNIIRYSGTTYRRYLDSFGFQNSELIERLDIFSSFSALSGDRCAALLTACAMMTTLEGSYRPSGGFIGFPDKLSRRLKELGGEIRTGTRVDRILTENGKIMGVQCGETVFSADYVVSTADTFTTFEELLGSEVLKKTGPRYFRKYRRALPSSSSFTIHLGLDESIDLKKAGFDCGYNVLTTGRAAHEESFRRWEGGENLMEDDSFHMAVISPSAMIGGKSNLIIHVNPAAPENWIEMREQNPSTYKDKKRLRAEWYIDKVEKYMIPGLRGHILFTDVATPATYARYLGSTNGANSDMLSLPSNFGMHRLPTRTPIKGLFLPKFSHGIWPSLQAGLQTVDMITGGLVMSGRARYNGPRESRA